MKVPIDGYGCFISRRVVVALFHDELSLLYFLTSCPCFISWRVVLALFPDELSLLYFLTSCPCFISWRVVVALFPDELSLLYFLTSSRCFFPVEQSLLYFPKSCYFFLQTGCCCCISWRVVELLTYRRVVVTRVRGAHAMGPLLFAMPWILDIFSTRKRNELTGWKIWNWSRQEWKL